MTANNDFDVDSEQSLYVELNDRNNRRYNDQKRMGLEFADTVDRLSTARPYGHPDAIMSAAEAIANGVTSEIDALQMIDSATEVDYQSQAQEMENNRGGVPEWLKTGTRWAFAGLELVPQLATNTAMRTFNYMGGPGDESFYTPADTSGGFFDGWFASTDLGAMLSGEDAGNGFFIGEKAYERQQEAVKEYRGMYDGNALTLGRAFSGIFLEPGSVNYNILSGLVDARQAFAVPSLPGAKAARTGTTAVADAAGMRRLSGLTDFGSRRINSGRANEWLETNSGNAVSEYIAKVDNIEDMAEILPNGDLFLRQDLVNATDADAVKKVLRNNLDDTAPTREDIGRINRQEDRLGLGTRPGLMNIDDIKISGRSALYRSMLRNNGRIDKAMAPVPDTEFLPNLNDLANPLAALPLMTKTLDDARNYMRLVKADKADVQRVLDNLTTALRRGDRGAAVEILFDDFTEVLVKNIVKRQSKLHKALIKQVGDADEAISGAEDFIREMFAGYRREYKEAAVLGSIKGMDETGVLVSDEVDELVVAVAGADGAKVGKLRLDTAHTATEVDKNSLFFPDPRRIRRVTSQFAPIWTKAKANPEVYGNPNGWSIGTQFVFEKLFRTMTLITGGYTTRNMFESGARQLNITGIDTGPLHPIAWLRAMARITHKGDIDGNEYTQAGARLARGDLYQWDKASGVAAREAQLDPAQRQILGYENGSYEIAVRGQNESYIEGIATEIRLLAGDEVAVLLARNNNVNDVVKWLKSAEGADYLGSLESRWKGRLLRDERGREFRGDVVFRQTNPDGSISFVDSNLRKFVESMQRRLEVKTANKTSLKEVIANSDNDGLFTASDGVSRVAFANGRRPGGLVDPFERYEITDAFKNEIYRLVKEDTDFELPSHVKYVSKPGVYRTQQRNAITEWADKTTRHFFSYVFGKKEAFLNRSPVFRQFYYSKLDDLMAADQLSQEAYEYMYKNIVEAAVKQPEEKLRLMESVKPNRFGKYEWNGFDISETEFKARKKKVQQQYENAQKFVRERPDGSFELLDDTWASNYVGSKERWEMIKRGRETADAQGLTGPQASFVSKTFAADETQRAFFNAAETNNFTDIMKIAIPFGNAWKESMTYQLKEVAIRPNRVRKIANTVRSIRDSDIDNDGNAFFYEDPSGEMMFNVPFGREAAIIASAYAGGILGQTFTRGRGLSFAGGALAGGTFGAVQTQNADEAMGNLGVQWTSPARSFSQVLQILPGFGPAVQIPAGEILRDKPQYKDLLKFVSPFGGYENVTDALTPSWAKKFLGAVTADPRVDRWYGELYMDSLKSLIATGEFDTSNDAEFQQAEKQAREMARSLLYLRALGQFTGPYRPEPELTIPTQYKGKINIDDATFVVENDIRASVLAGTFRALQQEEYSTAVLTMVRAFGPDIFMFLPGKTKTTVKGLQATDVFDKFYTENKDFAEAYDNVYAFFAPEGGEFNFQAYLRTIFTGERVRYTDPDELKADAEAIIGRALYMQEVTAYGPVIDAGERQLLADRRRELEKQYPGFGVQTIDVNEQKRTFDELTRAANDLRMDQNEVAQGVRKYMEARERVIAIAVQRSGSYSDKILERDGNADLRRYLRDFGTQLMQEFPMFGRVYSRLLFDEISEG
ncbi:MAG: hypothetical protein ACYTEW_13595 [Planctomycetota bacterium]